jgi:hypothetical protein
MQGEVYRVHHGRGRSHGPDPGLPRAPPDEFLDPITAAVMSDPVVLPSSRVTVDRSTAERLLLELKGKLGDALPGVPGAGAPAERSDANDVLNALLALGYSDKEAMFAVKQVPPGTAVGDGIRLARGLEALYRRLWQRVVSPPAMV